MGPERRGTFVGPPAESRESAGGSTEDSAGWPGSLALALGARILCVAAALFTFLPAALAVARPWHAPHRRPAEPAREQAADLYASIVRDLGTDGGLFRDANGDYAHAWPFSQALAAAIAVAAAPGADGRTGRTEVRRLVDLLPSYRAGTAYRDSVRPGGLHFFDDNEWLALDLVDASQLLHDRTLLVRAERIFGWITSGWDASAGDACRGGVYWANTPKVRDRNAVSTANGAVLALELYRATSRPGYLAWGKRMYAWVRTCLADHDGLFFDHLDSRGRIDQTKWAYNQGAMVAASTLLHTATGSAAYLHDATTLADAALRYFDSNGYTGQPAIFVAIFFRYLEVLDRDTPQPRLAVALSRYVTTHEAAARPSGSELLDRAASVQLAAMLARVN